MAIEPDIGTGGRLSPINAGVSPAIFTTDGSYFVPTSLAEGPWGQFIGGQYMGGLLARAIERDVDHDDTMQFARLTVDLPRRAALQPVQVNTTVHRQGPRIRLVDAAVIQNGTTVARARAVFLRQSEQPDNDVWSSPLSMPAIPDEPGPAPEGYPLQVWAFNSGEPDRTDYDFSALQRSSQKFLWLRFITPLVQGEHITPFTRAAMAADATSALTHYGPAGLHFINADYTLTLSRQPEGLFIGLAALTHYSDGGVATGVATVFDQRGPIGNSMTIGIANRGFPQTNTAESAGTQ